MPISTLINYFDDMLPLNDADKAALESISAERKVKKRQLILEEGQVCSQNTFVVEGCFKMYLVDESGKEHNLQFAIENWWIGDLGSFHSE